MAKETQHGTMDLPDSTQGGLTDAYADGGIDVTSGFNPKDAKGRQTLPTTGIAPNKPGNQPVTVTTFQGKFDTGPVMDGHGDEGNERDVIPDQDMVGGIPEPFAGDMGQPVDLAAVAPYKYPEFPADSYKSGLKNTPIIGG